MSFPQYEKMKNSGVEWLGDMPSHWRIVPLLSVAIKRDEPNIGMKEGNLLSLSYGQVVPKDIKANDGLLPESFETYQIVQPGDVVWRLTDLQNDKRSLRTALVNEVGIITSAYLATRPRNISPNFFGYLLRAYDITKVSYSMGGGLRQSMKFDDVKRLPIIVPPPAEQTAIAAFLDRETAKIDKSAEEQKRLIELLKEKRQAVIAHAVTKGLNPNAPLKNTDVEWLGQVPSHWEITRIKYISSHVVDCIHTTPTYDGYVEYPAVRTADVERGRLLLEQVRLVSRDVYDERIQRLKPTAGDILYSREGERFGMAALVPPGIDLCLGQRMMMFRVILGVSAGYVMWALNSECIFQQVLATVAGATSPHVNISDVINFHIAHPPLSEQTEIASFLELETSRLDLLTAAAEDAISLLQERRAALISAAVTGRIDVRGPGEFDAPIPDVVAA